MIGTRPTDSNGRSEVIRSRVKNSWQRHEKALAQWAFERYLNRDDTYGKYVELSKRGQINAKSGKQIGKQFTVKNTKLTLGVCRGHFRAESEADIIGFHAVGTDDKSSWVAIDIDAHGADRDNAEVAARNLRFAMHVWEQVHVLGLGMSCLFYSSNGRGGYHIILFFSERIPALLAMKFGEWLTRDWQQFGFTEPVEVYPRRETHLTDSGSNYGGGWFRAIGRHHSTDVLPEVWNGEAFVKDDDAVDVVLSTTGCNPDLIPQEARGFKTAREREAEENRARAQAVRSQTSQPAFSGMVSAYDVAVSIADRFPDRLNPPNGGSGRHHTAYNLCCYLYRGTGISFDQVLSIVASRWNHRAVNRCGELKPFTDSELEHKVRDAMAAVDREGGPTLMALRKAEEWAQHKSRRNGHATKSEPAIRHGGEDSSPPETGDVQQPERALFEIDDPRQLALMVEKHYRTKSGESTLVRHNSEFHVFGGNCYRPQHDEGIKARVLNLTQIRFQQYAAEQLRKFNQGDTEGKRPPTAPKVRGGLVNDITQHLAAIRLIDSSVVQPSWLRDPPSGFSPREIILAQNGIFSLSRLVAGDPNYRLAPTPNYFATSCMPVAFDEYAPEPKSWLKFLRELWPDDPDSILCLQEWFGLFLVADTRMQKILLLIGPRRSGKGTIGRILRALLGPDNVAGPTFASLATNFGLSPLIGKNLAIIGDARLSSQTDVAVVAERLLQISGEDGITIDRKFLPPINTTLPTRFMVCSNELLRLTDASNALAGRFNILRLTESFYNREDHSLTDKLMDELPSILTWAVAGWQRLQENGRFTIPQSSHELVRRLEDSASPVSAFLRDNCEVGPAFEVDKEELFAAWKDWCESENRAHPGAKAQFAIQLGAVVPTLDSKRAQSMGVRINRFVGIRLKPNEEASG